MTITCTIEIELPERVEVTEQQTQEWLEFELGQSSHITYSPLTNVEFPNCVIDIKNIAVTK